MANPRAVPAPEPNPPVAARVFVVIPAFNEAPRLGAVADELRQERPDATLVVVDDGSTDETSDVALRHGCTTLRHAINRGQGAALETGIAYSLRQGADLVVTFDADGQHRAADLENMLAPVLAGEVDVTLGSRFLGGSAGVPRARRRLLRTARIFTWLLSGLRLTDCHNGFRVLSRRACQRIHLRQDRMAHASEFYDQLRRGQLSFREVPVACRYSAETLGKGQKAADALGIVFQYLFGRSGS